MSTLEEQIESAGKRVHSLLYSLPESSQMVEWRDDLEETIMDWINANRVTAEVQGYEKGFDARGALGSQSLGVALAKNEKLKQYIQEGKQSWVGVHQEEREKVVKYLRDYLAALDPTAMPSAYFEGFLDAIASLKGEQVKGQSPKQ
jgi:hypothetical protein